MSYVINYFSKSDGKKVKDRMTLIMKCNMNLLPKVVENCANDIGTRAKKD